ncbi:hypothetical protein FLONG3_2741 [Fusarium longipes]|uniref:Xylanolytic transcriptional activator regulatory domain-containing protein n=1 Tax=Fusarium longipes TaxID=694270 RepID=A0A395T3B2_9HYPO|nr:hypothetical protein FLONG3_2741 [Fusarium longipes]
MASLKNIMNIEDEPVDPRSESRFTDLSSRSPSVHSYVTSLTHQTPSSPHNKPSDPPVLSKSPSVVDHSSPRTTDLNMNNRRRSNMSIDSNETPYAPAQHASSSKTPMRPFTAAASGESHIKLTPITRKISKARKGVPVHNCDQCSKTFSRAEHLRCGPGDISSVIHLQIFVALYVVVTSPSTARTFSIDMFRDRCPISVSLAPPTGIVSNAPGPWSPVASTTDSNTSYKPTTSINGPDGYMSTNNYVLDPEQPVVDDFVSNYSGPRSMPVMSALHVLPEGGTPELHWPDSSASTSTFSTPPDNNRHSQFPASVTNGPWMNPTPTYQGTSNDIPSTGMGHSNYHGSYTYNDTPPQVFAPDFGGMDLSLPGFSGGNTFGNLIPTSTVRSVSPSLAVAQSETLAAVPSLPTSSGTFDLAGCGSGNSGGNGLLSTEDLMPLSLSPAASEAIPRYLEVYWSRLHPKIPIVHKHTFQDVPEEETEHHQVLQCAMAALATQLIPNADDRINGAQLHAYAWQKSKVFTQVEKWSTTVQQTIALCEYYARFRGRKPHSHQPSARFTSLYHRLMVSRTPMQFCHRFGLLFSKNSPNTAYSYNDKGVGSAGPPIMVKITHKKSPQNHF